MFRGGFKKEEGKYGLLPSPGGGVAKGNEKKPTDFLEYFYSEHVE